MDSPFQPSSQQPNIPSDGRACHMCRTTKTSQWRYRHPDNKILCNACGIRWKRKNKQASQDRVKPGRKTGSKLTSSSPRAGPSKSSNPFPKGGSSKSSHSFPKGGSSKTSFPSSSAGPSKPPSVPRVPVLIAPARINMSNTPYTSDHKPVRSRHDDGRSHHRSKMAISNLMSPYDVEPRRSKKH